MNTCRVFQSIHSSYKWEQELSTDFNSFLSLIWAFSAWKKGLKKSTPPLSAKECFLQCCTSTVCLTSVCTAAAVKQCVVAAAARLYTEMHFFSAIIIVITCHSITNTIRPLLPAAFEPACTACTACAACSACLCEMPSCIHTIWSKQSKSMPMISQRLPFSYIAASQIPAERTRFGYVVYYLVCSS